MMQSTMSSIKNLVEVNNIVGEPIVTPDGQTIIPVSKLSFGFGGAGGDSLGGSKQEKTEMILFKSQCQDRSHPHLPLR